MKIGRNVVWNLLGTGLPLLAAIFAIPVLLRGMGPERFGVLTLAWVIVGYFSIFDLGLGRAVTKLTAERLALGKESEIPGLVWTALAMMAVLGLVGGLALFLLTPWLVSDLLNLPAFLRQESRLSFFVLAISIPVVIITSGARGVLEGFQKFAIVNLLRLPMGLATFIIPVIILPVTKDLSVVVAGLVAARFVFSIAHVLAFLILIPRLRVVPSITSQAVRPLLGFGGWMTISNLVSPLLVYLDRFFIGSILSVASVAYYATPYEMITRLLVIPRAVMGVLFPAFSMALASRENESVLIFERWNVFLSVSLFPVVLTVFAFADRILSAWLGEAMAEQSVPVLRLLSLGVFINGMAHMAFGIVQAAGRPDYAAKLHLAELPVYVMLLWVLTTTYGIVGAAAAWVIRVFADAAVLLAKSLQILNLGVSGFVACFGALFAAILTILPAMFIDSELSRLGYVLVLVLVVMPVAAWRQLPQVDKVRIREWGRKIGVARDMPE